MCEEDNGSSLTDEIAEAVAEVFSESFGLGEGFADYCRDVAGKIEHRITKYENRLKATKIIRWNIHRDPTGCGILSLILKSASHIYHGDLTEKRTFKNRRT